MTHKYYNTILVKQIQFTLLAISFGYFHRSSFSQASSSAIREDAGPVKVAFYYETKCGDSQRFVREQLAVTYPQLYEVMDVDINAYGKANVSLYISMLHIYAIKLIEVRRKDELHVIMHVRIFLTCFDRRKHYL